MPANPIPDDDDDIFLGPDDEPPKRKREARPGRARPLRWSPNLFVRVPLQWLTHPAKGQELPADVRLFLYIQLRSHEGQRGVVLTDKFAAEVGVEASLKRRVIRRLEKLKMIRVERASRLSAPVVWPIVLRG